jgi:glycosyltransferase involved in cell wall biosynthesis
MDVALSADPQAKPVGEDPAAPLVSIVVPCLNEQVTIGEFVDWCKQGLADAGVTGEILIVDSSTDRSPEIAQEHGATVLTVPKRGLGRAYIDALPHIRGRYVIMGDCDLTYDFRELKSFVDKLEGGAEFVMGSRFTGSIEPGAMPKLHQYFGTPATTWILNRIYGTKYTDIHCGMRGITRDALERIGLQSQGWEYASEMVIKAATLKLPTDEVPITFYKDREGRTSQHVRAGWMSPWLAGWDNVKAMMMYAPHAFITVPGLVLLTIGLVLCTALIPGDIRIGGTGLELHWMLLGMTIATVGYAVVQLGVIAEVRHHVERPFARRVERFLTWNRGTLLAFGLILGGIACNVPLVVYWVSHDFHLKTFSHLSAYGLLLLVLGFQTFCFTLLLQILPPGDRDAAEA